MHKKHFSKALEYITSHSDVWLTTAGEIAGWYYEHYYERSSVQAIAFTMSMNDCACSAAPPDEATVDVRCPTSSATLAGETLPP